MGGARALAALGLLGGCRAMIWAPKNPKNSMWCEPLSHARLRRSSPPHLPHGGGTAGAAQR